MTRFEAAMISVGGGIAVTSDVGQLVRYQTATGLHQILPGTPSSVRCMPGLLVAPWRCGRNATRLSFSFSGAVVGAVYGLLKRIEML